LPGPFLSCHLGSLSSMSLMHGAQSLQCVCFDPHTASKDRPITQAIVTLLTQPPFQMRRMRLASWPTANDRGLRKIPRSSFHFSHVSRDIPCWPLCGSLARVAVGFLDSSMHTSILASYAATRLVRLADAHASNSANHHQGAGFDHSRLVLSLSPVPLPLPRRAHISLVGRLVLP
jgi:hypothetical protein